MPPTSPSPAPLLSSSQSTRLSSCVTEQLPSIIYFIHGGLYISGLPWWINRKESACNVGASGDVGSISGSGRSPGGGRGNPLQYSCLENLMDRGAWWVKSMGVAKSRTQLQWLSTAQCIFFRATLSFSHPAPSPDVPTHPFSMSACLCSHPANSFIGTIFLDPIYMHSVLFSSVAQLCLTLWPHGLQHSRPPCPSPTPGVTYDICFTLFDLLYVTRSRFVHLSSTENSFPIYLEFLTLISLGPSLE